MNKTIKLVKCVIYIVIFCLALVVILSTFKNPFNVKVYNVLTGSMAPSIPAGSIIFVKNQDLYKPGEIITFFNNANLAPSTNKETVTHRINALKQVKGETQYISKGDANQGRDFTPIKKSQIIGKVLFNLPLLGYFVAFAKTTLGLTLLIIIPATLLVYGEIINIKNEVMKKITKNYKTKGGEKNE